MTYPIPDAALDNHIAILGKTGSGKSNAAKTIAERLAAGGKRWCAIDPTGTWWGMRLSADGKAPSPWPVVIFGGEHADLALGPEHGPAIAEAIGTSATSAIIDTRAMTVGARTKFFTGFAEGLIRTNQGELTLIVDEAHLFAPQGRVADPRSGEMLHAANNLVSLGRGVGLRIVLLTQRPAKLHKDSLTQVETLVAMRLIHNLDVDAVKAWIGEWADPGQGRELVASLPGLGKGEAWVWSPEIGFLARSTFPLVATFDSGKPRPDRRAPKLRPIDVQKIAERLTTVAADALANDPARLKARIAELEKAAAMPADPEALEAARAEGYDAGFRAGEEAGEKGAFARGLAEGFVNGVADGAHKAGSIWAAALDKVAKIVGEAEAEVERTIAARLDQVKADPDPAIPSRRASSSGRAAPRRGAAPAEGGGANAPPLTGTAGPKDPRQEGMATRGAAGAAALAPAKQKILVALQELQAIGQAAPEKSLVAWFAEASPSSSAFANNLGALRSAGLLVYPAGGRVALTEAGRAAAPPAAPAPATHAELMARIRAKLAPAMVRLLEVLAGAYPEAMGNAELAALAGASPTSSAFANNRGRLRSLGLVDYPESGKVRAADLLFP